ncbi:MAG TPA: DEAD/DEAH box helicase, partial [Longimicrobium sp.]|nr:DEAD/DEAH box helicase [Longimicrobium sp.]
MTFEDLKLSEPLLRAVRAEGYSTPTPIQQQAIPHALQGRDVLGCAQTGTGKTAAFALPILQRLAATKPAANGPRPIRCLVLTPTRELATQIGDSFATYGKNTGLTYTVIFGGVGQGEQERQLRRGIDILVATPGRLLDLMSQKLVSYRALEVFVLDEADRMLDMGFIHDVKRIIAAIPQKRQTLFFSATMPPDIQRLADNILVNPVRVEVTPVATTAETVDQRVYLVEREQKRNLLVHLLGDASIKRALVFTRTKAGANRVAKHLNAARISADAIHGNKSQNARERALDDFKTGTARVLVATDIAARGIDIDDLPHVVNYEIPNVPEDYVHRIGRTGRAGKEGQ